MASLILAYPPSGNRYWRVNRQTGRPYKSDEARAYIEDTGWRCIEHGMIEPLAGTVAVRLEFHTLPGCRIDLDNGVKVLLDALQGYAYADDKQVVKLEAELVIMPRNSTPCVFVTVEPCTARERTA